MIRILERTRWTRHGFPGHRRVLTLTAMVRRTGGRKFSPPTRGPPSMSGAVPRIFPKGTPVQVLQSKNGWLRVEERDSAAIGWVYGSLLK